MYFLKSPSHAATNIPVIGSTGATMVGLAGELINLIATHAPDKPIIREASTFMVDRKKYPMLMNVDFLRSDVLEICETGFEKKANEYNSWPERETLSITLANSKTCLNQRQKL